MSNLEMFNELNKAYNNVYELYYKCCRLVWYMLNVMQPINIELKVVMGHMEMIIEDGKIYMRDRMLGHTECISDMYKLSFNMIPLAKFVYLYKDKIISGITNNEAKNDFSKAVEILDKLFTYNIEHVMRYRLKNKAKVKGINGEEVYVITLEIDKDYLYLLDDNNEAKLVITYLNCTQFVLPFKNELRYLIHKVIDKYNKISDDINQLYRQMLKIAMPYVLAVELGGENKNE